MLDTTKYENKLSYPKSISEERTEYRNLLVKDNLSPAQKLRIEELKPIIDEFDAKRKAYRDEDKRLYEQFKKDLFEEYGVTNNPKVEQAYSLAYAYGHSCGLNEIQNYFSELVDLII